MHTTLCHGEDSVRTFKLIQSQIRTLTKASNVLAALTNCISKPLQVGHMQVIECTKSGQHHERTSSQNPLCAGFEMKTGEDMVDSTRKNVILVRSMGSYLEIRSNL
jgi:hypothetical protein